MEAGAPSVADACSPLSDRLCYRETSVGTGEPWAFGSPLPAGNSVQKVPHLPPKVLPAED